MKKTKIAKKGEVMVSAKNAKPGKAKSKVTAKDLLAAAEDAPL